MGRSLDDYHKKRNFQRTPEPVSRKTKKRHRRDRVFVIHRHDARRLHWDLRLEMDGVLKSWAVPRGLSWNPEDKRLAVRTEDHPLEYEDFEGEIPRGQYGAGTLAIWDRGTYAVVGGHGTEGMASGKLEIVLRGRRARGEWHLVRTQGGPNEDSWLLFKAQDRYARTERSDDFGPALEAARKEPLPAEPAPMLAGSEGAPFSDPAWSFEMRFEGRRVLAAAEGGTLRWWGRELPVRPPADLAAALSALRAEHFLLDGVLVVQDSRGRPCEERLARRLAGTGDDALLLYAFDLLHWEEWDLRGVPLLDRKAVLASILPARGPVLHVDHVAGNGEGLAAAAAAAGISGIVAKRSDSAYVAGPSEDWIDIPVHPTPETQKLSIQEALGARQDAAPESRHVRFTNLGKVWWPKEGFTKGDIIRWYGSVAHFILPHLHERPVHLRRCPDGIEGEFFYQREAPAHLPGWIETELISVSGKGTPVRHMLCNDRDSLLYYANLGSIDLHPWMSRRTTPDAPDWVVIDLDPKGAPFEHVVRVARATGKLLRAIGVEAWLKTSGSTGLHIFIPLAQGYTYEQGRLFCESVCRVVAAEQRDVATVVRDPRRRGGKVYLDYLQNHRGDTVVAPYVVRPVPGATVSTPLLWEELDAGLDPARFTIETVPDRLARYGDLFRQVLDRGQHLLAPIEALQALLKQEAPTTRRRGPRRPLQP